jgi:4-amino-4-deoxy-L-arabinose transferase-like glycosyltransferase
MSFPEAASVRIPASSGRGRLALLYRRVTDPAVVLALVAPMAAAVVTMYLVIPTLLPGVADWDTAEFQTVGPLLGTAHPTGYPAYVILGWVASILLQPFGDPAYRMNLLQMITAAAAVAGAVGLVQLLTGRRWIALATGLMLGCSQLFWRLATHADPHMLHVALVAVLFLLLLTWDRRRHSEDPEIVGHADRWLVAAAFVYGVAVANHSLALLLPPAIGLFLLAVDWRVLLRWRTVLACVGVLAATLTVFFLELPIRAAMHAPLVYGHPDTWSGFTYVVLAEQFRGSLVDPFGNLGTKASAVMDLITGWLGPVGIVAAVGLATSLVRRPRYILLSGLSAFAACFFAASYANADIERYYLVPLLVAYTWIGLGAADLVSFGVWIATRAQAAAYRPEPDWTEAAEPAEAELVEAAEPSPAESARSYGPGPTARWPETATLVVEGVVAAALIVGALSVVQVRQLPQNDLNPGGVSEATWTTDAEWVHAVLAPPDRGGLPENSVIESRWDVSTTLWYGQKVEGLRPDVLIVDDSTRKNDRIGEVWDVFDLYLGKRPVFTDRFVWGCDGLDALVAAYDLKPTVLAGIYQVVGRVNPQITLGKCDPAPPPGQWVPEPRPT